jgi:small conductance mechanosensitive channel
MDMTSLLDPGTVAGALIYGALFFLTATLLARALRMSVHQVLAHKDHVGIDRTGIVFVTQLSQILIYLIAAVLYAHLIPTLRQLGTALLAGAGVASVVIGLAAQSTLGNLVSGLSILLYRPVRMGDRVQVASPAGPTIGVIESLSLGYTFIRADDGRKIIVPNSIMASQVTVNLNDVRAG